MNLEKFAFCTGDFLSPVATVRIREQFPFDLAFSMTTHKGQGRTIYRVVIDLPDHPFRICRMQYAAIFVAMSRVALGEHLRLLEPPLVQSRLSLYEYIGEIAPLPDITPFLFGYTDDGASWNPDKALSYSTH